MLPTFKKDFKHFTVKYILCSLMYYRGSMNIVAVIPFFIPISGLKLSWKQSSSCSLDHPSRNMDDLPLTI